MQQVVKKKQGGKDFSITKWGIKEANIK